MRTRIIISVIAMATVMSACSNQKASVTSGQVIPEDAFSVTMPEVTRQIDKVSFNALEQSCLEASNTLGFNILQNVYKGNNTVVSPLSLYLALGMLAAGAEGETLGELLEILGAKDCETLKGFASRLLTQMPAVDLSAKLKMANTVIVNDKYRLNAAYRDEVAKNYYAPVESLPFENEDLVVGAVNAWCDKVTEGLIPQLLERIDETTVMFIINALYFKAAWEEPFGDEQVKKRPFNGGNTPIDYLCEMSELKYAEGNGYRVARKDFSGGKYAFDIILPDEDESETAILSRLVKGGWNETSAKMESQLVRLQFPVIDDTVGYELSETLRALGLRKTLSRDAELSPMFEDAAVWPGQVIQKGKVCVNQFGAEAAAISAVLMATSAGPDVKYIDFDANRPFIYVISETTSGTILYAGVFSE